MNRHPQTSPDLPCIVCVGHAALDHVYSIGRFPDHPTKTPAHSYAAVGGGMAANAALAASRLGARVRFVGAVGDDTAGQAVRAQLAAEGIDLSHLQVVPQATTSSSAIIVDAGGERHIFNHRGDALARAQAPADDSFCGCDAVLVDPRWMTGAQTALRWARQHGRLSVLDADVAPREDLAALVPLADWAAFSEPGLKVWAGDCDIETGLRRALDCGASHAVVTLGERGAYLLAQGSLAFVPAFEVQAVDTTGAGDVFHGALALALAQGRAAMAALRYASAAAALKCTRAGGVRGAPDADAVDAFMNREPIPS